MVSFRPVGNITLIKLPARSLRLPDSVHAAVQQAGKVEASKMVRRPIGEEQEEAVPGVDREHPLATTQNVVVPGVEGPQDCVQTVPPNLNLT